MTDSMELLALQDLDSDIGALGHRRTRLPERAALQAAEAAVTQSRRRLAAERRRSTEAQEQIEALEKANEQRDVKRARLEKQLKTVFAPREAEALMHGIALLSDERSAADDQELALLDTVESADTAAAQAEQDLQAAELAVAEARSTLAGVEAELDAQEAGLTAERVALAAGFDQDVITRYDRARKNRDGVAIARIVNGRCGACHLDLSRAFVDRAKHATTAEPADCEQCGRWLVVAPMTPAPQP